MWNEAIVTYVLLLHYAVSQCSQAHRQACSYSYIQLQVTSADITSSSTYIPEYNETTLRNICSVYRQYKDCTQPFLETCNSRTVRELQTYNITLGPICGNLLSDYLEHRSCYKLLHNTYTACKEKAINSTIKLSDISSHRTPSLCSTAKDYVLCIYSATALGCSMNAADTYFKLLNHTFTSIFDSNTYQCVFRNPMDVISIYTTSQSTTTNRHNYQTTTNDHRRTQQSREVSMATWLRSPKLSSYLMIVFIQLLLVACILQTPHV